VSFYAGILKQYIGATGYIAGGIESKSILVLLKSLKIPALCLQMVGSENPAKQSGKKIKPR
jgi:hypothetical protein